MLSGTLIYGLAGAGKSALARHMLHQENGLRSAWVADDDRTLSFDSLSVDLGKSTWAVDQVLHFKNGSTFALNISSQLERLSASLTQNAIEHVFLLCSGKPQECLKKIDMGHRKSFKIERLFVVIDCLRYWKTHSEQLALEKPLEEETYLDALIAKAQAVLLNKRDLCSKECVDFVRSFIQKINPDAVIEETKFGKIDGKKLIESTRPSFDLVSLLF